VIYSKEGAPLLVPVGEDQVSHVELSREIVRRFNLFYGFELDEALRSKSAAGLCGNFYLALGIHGNTLSILDFPLGPEKWAEFASRVRTRILEIGIDNAIGQLKAAAVADMVKFSPVLREPDAKLTLTPRIPGTDGRKMSKSYGNAITLSETDAEIRAKTKVMVTDPARKRRTDPGNPDVCPVYDWHKLFSAEEPGRLEWVRQGCTTAGIGCIECKAAMAENLIKWIAPVRERRVKWENDPKGVLEILDAGSNKARAVAQGTMERVREAVFGWEKKREEIGGVGG
jgi:tryptophanyl-tRNA synthetase